MEGFLTLALSQIALSIPDNFDLQVNDGSRYAFKTLKTKNSAKLPIL